MVLTGKWGDKSKYTPKVMRVRACARLHLGFLDLGGHLGRRFGSVGVAIDDIATEIVVTAAPELRVSGTGGERVPGLIRRLCRQLDVPCQLHVHFDNQIPPHAGLGSGTQLALALGIALSRFWNKTYTPRHIAQLSGRGTRSGIGIAAFERGGVIVDGGRGEETDTPPLLSRLPMPHDWRWVLVFDTAFEGLHGERETEAFHQLPRFPRETAEKLCYRVLIQGLPALAESQFSLFSETLAEIQRANGDYFAPAQGGRYTSDRVAEALSFLARRGWVGLGQSSWGPTGFCLLPDPVTAAEEMAVLETSFSTSELRFQVVKTRNDGADIIG